MTKTAIVVGKAQDLPGVDIVLHLPTDKDLSLAVREHNPDLVIMDPQLLRQRSKTRENVSSHTHQGIQLLPVDEVIYFEADQKYVIAHHRDGQLLIDDTLSSLEEEFIEKFVRIHRKTLVACKYLESLDKTEDGKHLLKLRGLDNPFTVSRRQLPAVRKRISSL